jgi:HPt (histidine-containing phosphotransfer) domain-containing protein
VWPIRTDQCATARSASRNRGQNKACAWPPCCSSILVGLPALTSSVLDLSVAAAIRTLGDRGEPDVFAEVARLFLADVPIYLSALGAAIAADEKESVRKIAHRLRGGALEIGAVRMAPVCAAIEHAARVGSLENAAAQADSLAREFTLARLELEQVIQCWRWDHRHSAELAGGF